MPPSVRLSSSDEHLALAEAISTAAERMKLRDQVRRLHDQVTDSLPDGWPQFAAAELLAVAVEGDVLDCAVVACELGRALAAGPVVPTLVAARLAHRYGTAELKKRVEAGLRDGSFTAAVDAGGGLLVGGAAVSHVLTEIGGGWRLVSTDGCRLESSAGIDPSRRVARFVTAGLPGEPGDRAGDERLDGLDGEAVSRLLVGMLAAEACGIAAWCTDTAVAHAKVREQFGRPIGGFQAVKHRCADLYCGVELAMAAAWDGAAALDEFDRGEVAVEEADLATAVAATIALPEAVTAAQGLVQVLGGIGYTWEHDAHLFLKRALATRQMMGGTDRWRRRVGELAVSGVRRTRSLDLGDEADPFRARVREFLRTVKELDEGAQRRAIVDAGYLMPHWPKPYGLEAGPVEQLVIDEEFARAGVHRPDLVIGNWAVPTILGHGSDAQRERFVRPTLLGEIAWCQLFSEPGAGSDLASLTTKASRVPGGWSLSGQKVWTSSARTADWGICLARTSSGARRHDGITYFLVDMSAPGIDIRPLRELTGEALFNEVFLTDVFVPDDCVVGDVDGGWRLARTTLANERVAMSSGSAFTSGIEELLSAVEQGVDQSDPAAMTHVGALVARAHADAMLGLRATLARVSGTDPGAASSVRKLVGVHLRQDAAELALDILGPGAAAADDDASRRALHATLATRSLTIAGGTSEILRNVIGERILGLPR